MKFVRLPNKMLGIIEEWLFVQIGVNLNMKTLAENSHFRDGCLLFDILQKYGLLDANFGENIKPTVDDLQCKRNLQLLKPLFEMLRVVYDDQVIQDIVMNKCSTILKLLYEMYVCLENKQHLYFITRQNYEKILENLIGRPELHNVTVSPVEKTYLTNENECFEQPMIQNQDIIEWYKNKCEGIRKKQNEKGNILEVEPNKRNSNEFSKFRLACSSCDLNTPSNLPDIETFINSDDHKELLDYDQFIASFKVKEQKSAAIRSFETRIQNDLLEKTWNKVMEKQNEIYNSVFAEIMLKQSQYEKQIMTKLIQTQQQVRLQNENQVEENKKLLNEQENQINVDFKLKGEFEELERAYDDEQKRVLELHRKLYKAKQDITRKRHLTLCRDIMDALVDISVAVSDYKAKYGVPVSKRLWESWKQLFCKLKPVHIPFQEFEDEVKQGIANNYDDLIKTEKELSDILDENDVNEYIYTCGRWFFSDVCIEHEDINEDALAFIVYRLLYKKYPLPQSPLPADLPLYDITGSLIDLHNVEAIDKLKVLLSKSCIHVFDPEDAIKKCIAAFQKETVPFGVEKSTKKGKQNTAKISIKSKNNKKSETRSKTVKQIKEAEKKVKAMSESSKQLEELALISLVDKETQTSVIKEVEEYKQIRTPLGLVGEQVFNTIQTGEKINDDLLVTVILEYIKTLENVKGWLLLNYPTTIEQASIIELRLSGKKLPVDNYVSDENKFVAVEATTDEFIDNRKSKLFSCPGNITDTLAFKTYFTVFIKAKEVINNVELKNDVKEGFPEDDYESLGSENYHSIHNTRTGGVLEAVYSEQHIFREFVYDTLDVISLKRLARIILQADGNDGTGSVDLFGEESLNKLTKGKKKDKKRIVSLFGKTSDSAGKRKKSANNGNRPVPPESNAQEISELVKDPLTLHFEHAETDQPSEIQPKEINPGDEDWRSVTLPINDEIAQMLASTWENIEHFYLSNLKDVSFENRVVNLRLIPYSSYVKEKVEHIINKPDIMQKLLIIFQNYYNNIDNEIRAFSEVKSQLLCKVLELQKNLWKIADDRKREVESKRRSLILKNWLVNELCMLINNYLSLVQIEFDRSSETIKLVNDYYLSMLGRNLPSVTTSPETCVCKITKSAFLGIPDKTIPPDSVNTNEETKLQSSTQSIEDEHNFITTALINCYNNNTGYPVLNVYLLDEVERAKTRLNSFSQGVQAQIQAECNLLAAANKKSVKEQFKTASKGVKSKSPSRKTSMDKAEIGRDQVFDNNESLLKEWAFVNRMELKRFNFRMELINKRSKEDLMEFYYYLESVFCELYNLNLSRYNTAISNIGNLCKYFRTAIEEELPLTHSLMFEDDSFYVNISEDYGRKGPLDDVREMRENILDYQFTINQLNNLRVIFNVSGPSGVIRRQPLAYILLDLMLINGDDNQPHLPKSWSLLNEYQLGKVFDMMFGQEYAIDWRDFIIYNMEIPFPNVEDILTVRNLFMVQDTEETEVVPRMVFDSTTLWFEKELPESPEQGLRIGLIKNLLFDLFKVDDEKVNYTALLLYFCKDFDPKLGLRKALSISLGKNVITSKDELDEIIRIEAEVKQDVGQLLQEMINSIVHSREGVLIYEVTDYRSVGESWSMSEAVLSHSTGERQGTTSTENNSKVVKQELLSTNVFHEERSLDKWWVSKIPVDLVICVLNAVFYQQDQSYFITNMYLKCLKEEADSEGLIDAYTLMELSCIRKMFDLSRKFTVTIPCEVVKQCLKHQQ